MFSLQRILGRKKDFFDLLEASAQESGRCAEALKIVLKTPGSPEGLQLVREHRRDNKKISEQISELIVSTFVTALEREDIEALAGSLYKISKPIEKFADRFMMAHRFISDMNFEPQSRLIENAVQIVQEMVRELRKGNNLEYVRSLNARLQQVEADADALENALLQELYTNRNAVLRIIIIKDLYELLEKAIDRCRDAGNVVTHIVLKNS
ncbi:MAG: hypothetical protein RL417_1855 [Pseudomonadota bacterium]|jgi:uncharacterized protein Yka (UPF0111/DUF47 family)